MRVRIFSRSGSSPLARGTLPFLLLCYALIGLIPARAGNTKCRGRGGCTARAHPRSRGEHASSQALMCPIRGSSPLARGTRESTKQLRPARGLIPARAGNTQRWEHRARAGWAHPRSRGEHTAARGSVSVTAGSSPLARGTHDEDVSSLRNGGLIPARAGNTTASKTKES